MKKTVILLNPPAPDRVTHVIRDFYCSFSSKAGYYWPPQDLLALSGILRDAFDVQVIDAVALGLTPGACREQIQSRHAAVIIFSTGSVSLSEDMAFVESIKKFREVRLIASSGIFASCAEEMLRRYPFLDHVISDFTDPSIIRLLSSGDSGVQIAEDFSLGRPLYEQFMSDGQAFPFFGGSPFVIMVSSFGCKFCCGFCAAGTYKIKYRKLKEVIQDVQAVRQLGVQKFFFVDPLFTADPSRVLEFCQAVKDWGIEWICNAHAATIEDEGLLSSMKQAGCRALLIGVESGDDDILKKYHKATNTEQMKRVFALCKKQRITTLAYFIIGLPGENATSARKTIRFSKALKCDYASFGVATPDQGTRLRKDALEKGWYRFSNVENGFDPSGMPVLETERLSRRETGRLLQRAYRSFYLRPGYVIKSLSGVRSIDGLKALGKAGWSVLKKNIL